jgi:hypothetical protein
MPGERRGRYYVAHGPVIELRRRIRRTRPARDTTDPFDLASQQMQLDLG